MFQFLKQITILIHPYYYRMPYLPMLSIHYHDSQNDPKTHIMEVTPTSQFLNTIFYGS